MPRGSLRPETLGGHKGEYWGAYTRRPSAHLRPRGMHGMARLCPHQHGEGGSRGLRPVEAAGSPGTGGGERSPRGSLSAPCRNPVSLPRREMRIYVGVMREQKKKKKGQATKEKNILKFCRRSCSRDDEVPQRGKVPNIDAWESSVSGG